VPSACLFRHLKQQHFIPRCKSSLPTCPAKTWDCPGQATPRSNITCAIQAVPGLWYDLPCSDERHGPIRQGKYARHMLSLSQCADLPRPGRSIAKEATKKSRRLSLSESDSLSRMVLTFSHVSRSRSGVNLCIFRHDVSSFVFSHASCIPYYLVRQHCADDARSVSSNGYSYLSFKVSPICERDGSTPISFSSLTCRIDAVSEGSLRGHVDWNDPEGRAGGIPASCEIRLENPFAPCLFSSALSSAAFLCRYGRVRNPSIGKECVGNPYRDATKISVREVEVGRKH
jgi:hypothetical protein